MSAVEGKGVTVSESRNIFIGKVGQFIKENHPEMCLTDSSGVAYGSLPNQFSAIGFLVQDGVPQRRGLQKFLKGLHRRPFIGMLWIDAGTRHTSRDKWLLEVEGRVYLDQLTKLAEELSKRFNVSIHVRLKTERAGFEHFDYDYSGW